MLWPLALTPTLALSPARSVSEHGVAPSLAAADLLWAEVSYAAYRAVQPAANASAGVSADSNGGSGDGGGAASASLEQLLAPLQDLPSRPRDAADAGAPDGFGAYDQPTAGEGGDGGDSGGDGSDGAGAGLMGGHGGQGAVGGQLNAITAEEAGAGPRAWLVRHAAPVSRSGHTLTAVRVNLRPGGHAAEAGVEDGAEAEAEGGAEDVGGSEVLLLFGGEAAARVEHRVAEAFEASSFVAENVTLTRRAAGGGTYVGTKNLDPMQEAWGLEPPGQRVTVGFGAAEAEAKGPQTWEATPAAQRYWSEPAHIELRLASEQADHPRPVRRGVGGVDRAVHAASRTRVQRRRTLRELHAFDPRTASWVSLSPGGSPPEPRQGHAACAAGGALYVFGGWRLRECQAGSLCTSVLNDVARLALRPQLRWESPLLGGVPPTPRHGHSLSLLPRLGAHGALVAFGGRGPRYDAATHAMHGTYLNDVHVLDLGAMAWRRVRMQGAAPVPRAGHAAAVLVDGLRVAIFGGEDGGGPLADLHLLDVPRRVWWQAHASGDYPRPRAGHVAAAIGGDVLYFGGDVAEEGGGEATHLLNLEAVELRTTALLGPALPHDAALNASCTLHAGSAGAVAQLWRCGPMLRHRQPRDSHGAMPKDVGRGASSDPAAQRLRHFTEANIPVGSRGERLGRLVDD